MSQTSTAQSLHSRLRHASLGCSLLWIHSDVQADRNTVAGLEPWVKVSLGLDYTDPLYAIKPCTLAV
jgi:hypothetical protein